MKSLVCPISSEKINGNAARVNGFFVALSIALYILTDNVYIIAGLAVDFFIRACTSLPFSPLSWLASRLVMILGLKKVPVDKAPKVFAARIGLVFSLFVLAFHFIHPFAGIVFGLILAGCAFVEASLNFCVGCFVYTYLVLPLYRRHQLAD